MDIIQRAIEKKKHISKRKELNVQTWADCAEQAEGRKVFLFGAGACADYFFENDRNISLNGVVDSDVCKQGLQVVDFCVISDSEYGQFEILPPDTLKQYPPDDVVVLITSTNYYEAIIAQLEEMGIKNCFVLVIMEANERNGAGSASAAADGLQAEKNYAGKCCNEEINGLKIVINTFGTYSDHGKYIAEALLRIRKDLDIVYFLDDLRAEVAQGVRKVYRNNWKRYIYEFETAKIWICNTPVSDYIMKRPGQIYIQTKHWASVTLKKFYLDSPTTQAVQSRVDNWRYNSEIMDYMITGSKFDTESCRRGFGFNGEICQAGSPRSDALFRQEELKQKVYGYYGIKPETHLLIYAPTYRFDRPNGEYVYVSREIDLDYKMVKYALENRFGGEWNIMLRLHPSVTKAAAQIAKEEFVIDASSYQDSEELVAACDMMISDYSSIMFEPAFVMKPVFLFALDRENYIGKDYELLLDYDALPFPRAVSNDELERNILQFDRVKYEKNVKAFLNQYGVHEDGHASERAAAFILKKIDDRK